MPAFNLPKHSSRGLLLAFLLVPILFREVFITLLGSIGQALSLSPFIFAFAYALILFSGNRKVDFQYVLLLSWVFWIFTLVCLYGQLTVYGDILLSPILGSLQYLMPIILGYSVNKLASNRYGSGGAQLIIKYLSLFAIVTAVGSLIQFYVSIDLFGLISNRIYTNIDNAHVTKRAISFIASPQALGAFLGFSFPLISYYLARDNFKRMLVYLVVFSAGLHTGSKAFIVLTAVYFFALSPLRWKVVVLCGLGLLVSIYSFTSIDLGVDAFNRLLYLPKNVLYLTSYGTFSIWHEFLTYDLSLLSVLAGNGIGSLATSSQSIFGYKILNGSSESFLIQLYFETGVVGTLLFLLFYLGSCVKVLRSFDKRLGLMLFALLFNMSFTPAFFGFTFASICYVALFIPIQNEVQCHQTI
ncbi:MAG: hypothetical protein GJ680_00045 [Alteromonadaceae bacterium]|nr:hypothetical protein [Alteromonadaceae bacterium]